MFEGVIFPLRLGGLPSQFARTCPSRPPFFCPHLAMPLLYLDDSGSVENPAEEYLVLGGVSILESEVQRVTQKLDHLAETIHPEDPDSVEFHASEIFARRKNSVWRDMKREEVQGIIQSVLRILSESRDSVQVFACAVHKKSFPKDDPMKLAFEDLCSRFDFYLKRISAEDNRQYGILILDNSSHETILQKMARDFRTLGNQWGKKIRTIVDTPLFVDSRVSRIVQLADHVAYAVFRRYNAHDTKYFDIIASKFDSVGGVVHGLSHKQKYNPKCMCIACITRHKS